MNFLYVKALHIVFVVTWFSGMFYLCRLYIYNREAEDRPPEEKRILQAQFNIMIRRLLFGITWPSAILTIIFGSWLLTAYPVIPTWLWIKIGLVALLLLYHLSLHAIYRQQRALIFRHSGNKLRIWNEVPTLFLVSIVMLVVVRQNMSPVYAIAGLVAFAVTLMMAIRIYKAVREKKSTA